MANALKYKDINLIAAQDRKLRVAKEEKAVAIRLPVLILILVLLVFGLGYYYLYTVTNELESDKEKVSLYLNDPVTIADYNESLRMQDVAGRMVAQKEELEQVLLNLSSYPDMSGTDFNTIYEYAGTHVDISEVSYNRATGVLSFNAECETVTAVPIFVGQLRTTVIFDDVRYEGYTERIVSRQESIAPLQEHRLDEYGDPIYRPDGTPVIDLIPQTRTITEKTFIFAVTALVRAPEPQLPGPGQSVSGGAR